MVPEATIQASALRLRELCELAAVNVSTPPDVNARALLVDAWGRAHKLPSIAVLGRDLAADVSIGDDSVSRRHARLLETEEGWRIADLGSTNGTFVDWRRASGPTPLVDRAIVFVGSVGFVFLTGAKTQNLPAFSGAVRVVIRPDGRGLVEHGGARATLEPDELAFLIALAERLRTDADRPQALRGFVRSVEIAPTNVKPIVRHALRRLAEVGAEGLVEISDRQGYRLRAAVSVERS